MKRVASILMAAVLMVSTVPILAFAEDENPPAEPANNLTRDIYISEVFTYDTEDRYIELYYNKAIESNNYYLMTATAENSGLSSKFEFSIPKASEGQDWQYYIINKEYNDKSGTWLKDYLTNPGRVVWLCDSTAKTMTDCRNSTYVDKFQYGKAEYERSWSRDFDDPKLAIKVSKPTPNKANDFKIDDEDENEDDNQNIEPPDEEQDQEQYCSALRLSEISVYEQWIEIVNISDKTIRPENLQNCVLEIPNPDNPSKPYVSHQLDNISELGAYQYYVVELSFAKSFTKDYEKQNGRPIFIMDDQASYSDTSYKPLGEGRTLAYFGPNDWRITFAPTPAAENIYQQFQTCEVGKHINEKTGNCVKDAEPPAECAEGQFRNPETGRCKKNPEPAVLADCAEGQFRNPLTNRCKKIASDDDLVPCAEGYERNPETNRCRKAANSDSANFGVEPVAADHANDPWVWAGVGGVALIGALIAGQFHTEIGRFFQNLVGKIRK